MSDLIARYVHQVGRYLPRHERAEIEAELRSMIEDQLADRYGDTPSQAEVASVLAALGDPRQMAASYASQQYLVGPDLYPYMMAVLRYGWLLVPAVVVFLHVFGVLVSGQDTTPFSVIVQAVLAVLQVTFGFSAVVVLIFAAIQHFGVFDDIQPPDFDPLALPEVDDPGTVDRFESLFGVVFGVIVTLLLLYFLSVGGLTLRFDLNDPGEVISVPSVWLALLIAVSVVIIALQLVVLRRNRWSAGLWLLETGLEVVGVVCLYFVLYAPLLERLLAASPGIASIPLIDRAAQVLAVATGISTLVTRGGRLLKLWNNRHHRQMLFAGKTDG